MSKFLIVGDIHIPNTIHISGIRSNTIFNEIINTFSLIEETAEKENVETIIFLGDIFDVPDRTTTDISSIFNKVFYNLSLKFHIIIINGNHDIISNNEKIEIGDIDINYVPSATSSLKYFNNITVIETPTIVNVDNTDIDLVLIPYSNKINEDFKSLGINKKHRNVVMGHFEWFEKYHMMLENKGSNLIKIEDMYDTYNVNLCLCGHIHEPNTIKYKDSIFKYIGSCRNINFSNITADKFIYVMNTDDLFNLKPIKNIYTSIYKTIKGANELLEYIENNDDNTLSRTKLKYIYYDNKEVPELLKIKYKFKTIKIEKGINCNGNESNLINMSKDDLDSLGSLLQNDLLNEDKLIEYSFKFKKPFNEKEAIDFLQMVKRMG